MYQSILDEKKHLFNSTDEIFRHKKCQISMDFARPYGFFYSVCNLSGEIQRRDLTCRYNNEEIFGLKITDLTCHFIE